LRYTIIPIQFQKKLKSFFLKNTPETFEPETFEPETFEPETFEPETFEPETFEPETKWPTNFVCRPNN